jgi:K+-transporting ATPase ATPase C chain
VSSFLHRLAVTARALLVLTVVCGVVYPLMILGVGQARARDHLDGSIVAAGNGEVGTSLIVQGFTEDRWFQGRPSAPIDSVGTSGRGNLVPSREQQRRSIADRLAELTRANPDATGVIPNDALTAPANGLEANVSTAYALWQVPRVAKARSMPQAQVRERLAGFLGEPLVNVLELNLALGSGLPRH